MELFNAPVPGLTSYTISKFIPKNKGILIVGAGFSELHNELKKKDYDVACNDIDAKPKDYNGVWIKKDVLSLDYDSLTNKYPALVSICLCDRTGSLLRNCVNSGKWRDFEYVAIQLCSNLGCYVPPSNFGKMDSYFNITSVLKKMGFNTLGLNGGSGNDLELMILASKSKIPGIDELFSKDIKEVYEKEKNADYEKIMDEFINKLFN
jgi:hypothetical protein